MSSGTPTWLLPVDPPDAPPPPPVPVRDLQVHRPIQPRDVPYVPTDAAVVEAMLRLADVGPGDVLYDLGCGDGRIPIAAAKRGARAVGVDVDLQRVRECHENAARAGVRDRTWFLRQSFFDTDLRPATVVTLYLLPGINVRLRPKLLWELRPGARVVTNYFDMGDWPPDERRDAHRRTLYRYVVPAWVASAYHAVADVRRGGTRTRRRHFRLRLRRHYQFVTGTIRLTRLYTPIDEGRLFGDVLRFRAPSPAGDGLAVYACRVTAAGLRDGTCTDVGADRPSAAWAGRVG